MPNVILLVLNDLFCQVYLRVSSVFICFYFLIFGLHFFALLIELYKLLVFAFNFHSMVLHSPSHSIILLFQLADLLFGLDEIL